MEGSAGAASGLANNVAAIRSALEAAGVEFIPENGGGAGVRLRKGGKGHADHPTPKGPATRAVDTMDKAIEKDRKI